MRSTRALPTAVVLVATGLLSGCGGNTLVRATDVTPRPTSTVTKYGNPALLATPSRSGKATPARQATSAPAARPTPTRPRTTPPTGPAPTGTVVVEGFKRLHQSQQTRFGCDRVVVTLANRSTAAVTAVSVGFATWWYPDEEIGTGIAHEGRKVTVTRRLALAVGAKKPVLFEVCLPEKKTRNVFAEPESTSWVWART